MAATTAEGANDGGERMILLKSSDGEHFELSEAAASLSQTLSHMIEDDCADNGIPLPNVTADVLAKVVEYFNKHAAVIPKPAAAAVSAGEAAIAAAKASKEAEEKLKRFDTEFVKVDTKMLFELIMAANYLDSKGLLDLTCQRMADFIKDKTPEEIREMFGIANDFSPEEEAEIRMENAWAFEN